MSLTSSYPYLPEKISTPKTNNGSATLRRRRANQPVTTLSPPTLDSLADDDYNDDDDGDIDNDEFDEDPSKKDPSFLKREQMAVLMARESKKALSLLGHRFEDMVLSCTYRGVSCR